MWKKKTGVKGTIINKFRGDIELLNPGLAMLEDIIHIPSLGVVPHFNLKLEDEGGLDQLADIVRHSLDMKEIYKIILSN